MAESMTSVIRRRVEDSQLIQLYDLEMSCSVGETSYTI